MLNVDTIYQFLTKYYTSFQINLFNGYAFPPLHAFIDVTYQCNLRCNMCHSLSLIEDSHASNNSRKELTPEQIKKIISRLPRKALITFTGGEPFFRKDMLEILSSACKNYKCHVITNGTLMNHDTLNSLIELRSRSILASGLMMVGFSLEGPETIHDEIVKQKGSFQKTISTVKSFQKLKNQVNSRFPMVHMTVVITKKNVAHLEFIYSLSKELNFDYCNFILENTSEFTRNHRINDFSALYQTPPQPVKIEPDLLNSQLDQVERLASSSRTPKVRFSPNNINRQEIVKYFSTGVNYKDYRCTAPWSKIGFSAFGDVISCPHVKIGNMIENNYNTLWNSYSYKIFREKLKKEISFPRCPGCCHSEYIGKPR